MTAGRKTSYRNTGPGEITPATAVDYSRCKDKLTIIRRNIEWRGEALAVSDRAQIKACSIYVHGVVVSIQCDRCVSGMGPFRKCVVAVNHKGYVSSGVCANCEWLHRTDVCSSRHVKPCEALSRAGLDLGEFYHACQLSCGGIHSQPQQLFLPMPVLPAPSPAVTPTVAATGQQIAAGNAVGNATGRNKRKTKPKTSAKPKKKATVGRRGPVKVRSPAQN